VAVGTAIVNLWSEAAHHGAIMPLPSAHDPFPVLEESATKLQP